MFLVILFDMIVDEVLLFYGYFIQKMNMIRNVNSKIVELVSRFLLKKWFYYFF